MRSAQRLLAGLLLAIFGACLAYAALEAGVRLLHLVPTRFWEPDPRLGTRLIPGKQGWWTQEEHEFRVPIQINSHGVRDVEREADKSPNVFRVLLLGDSFIEAMQVPLEETLGRQLEARLNARGGSERYEVISTGVSGYGTASQLLYYVERGHHYSPDVVLLAFYPGNDLRNNSPTLEPVLPPVYDANGALLKVSAKRRKRDTQTGRRGLLARSQAYQYFRKVLITKHPQLASWLVETGLLKRRALRSAPMRNGIPLDYWVYAADPPAEWRTAWAHTERLLGELHDAVVADGGCFAVVIVTGRDQVYPDAWRQVVTANPAMANVRWDLQRPERELRDWCARREIPCLALSSTFSAHSTSGPPLHFLHDGHWTAAGHALAADTIMEFLRDEQMLPAVNTEVR